MKRIGIMGLLIVVIAALSGITASSAFAEEKLLSSLPYGCYQIDPAEGDIGAYGTTTCETLLKPRDGGYESAKPEVELKANLWCARVLEVHFKSALFEDAHCEVDSKTKEGDFLKILVPLCETHLISGQGSSLQKIAQENVWIPGSKCSVHYNPSGSAAGLLAFGVGGDESPRSTKDAFIGTDDAPSGSFSTGQLHEMEIAALGTATEPEDIVIPVAQAAIAVVVNPPTNCLLEKDHITNADLQHVFLGLTLLWSEISTIKEDVTGACKTHIIRVVRKDGSGTTYQFKHYLFEINKEKLPCVSETWKELQPETTQNLKWPECLGLLARPAKTGGGAVAELVKNLLGSIGYAALSDARAKFTSEEGNHYHWLAVENEHTKKFVFPGTSTGEPSLTVGNANCVGTAYDNKPSPPVVADVDWSEVYGGHPGSGSASLQNENYPICTLTWDVALMNYTQADLTHLEGLAAKEYLMYVTLKEEGQKALENHDYGQVEEAVGTYAELAALLVASAG